MLSLLLVLNGLASVRGVRADELTKVIAPPPEVLCAASLSSLAPHYLIQNADIADQIDGWHLTAEQKASLARDLKNPRMPIAVAKLKGDDLLAFLGRWEKTVDELDALVSAERSRAAAGFASARPWARTLGLALAAGAIGVSQHWGAQLAGHILLAASLLEAKMAYHRHTYLRRDTSLARLIDFARVGRVRNTLRFADMAINMTDLVKVPEQTMQFEGRLNQSLLRRLKVPRATPPAQMSEAVNFAVDVTRQWGWLAPYWPARRRVIFTIHVETDASGAPTLTLVSRIKRW